MVKIWRVYTGYTGACGEHHIVVAETREDALFAYEKVTGEEADERDVVEVESTLFGDGSGSRVLVETVGYSG